MLLLASNNQTRALCTKLPIPEAAKFHPWVLHQITTRSPQYTNRTKVCSVFCITSLATSSNNHQKYTIPPYNNKSTHCLLLRLSLRRFRCNLKLLITNMPSIPTHETEIGWQVFAIGSRVKGSVMTSLPKGPNIHK